MPAKTSGTRAMIAREARMFIGYLLQGAPNIVPYLLLCKAANSLSGGELLALLTISTSFNKRSYWIVGKDLIIRQASRRRWGGG